MDIANKYRTFWTFFLVFPFICIGNSIVCSDVWQLFGINTKSDISELLYVYKYIITSGIYAKYHVQIMQLFVYTTTRKDYAIFHM